MKYIAQENWIAQVYTGLTQADEANANKRQAMTDCCNAHLARLISEYGDGLRIETTEEKGLVHDVGSHFRYPVMRFHSSLIVSDSNYEMTCRLRVNPCWNRNVTKENARACKIWTILGSDTGLSSKDLTDFYSATEIMEEKFQVGVAQCLTENWNITHAMKVDIKNISSDLSLEDITFKLFSADCSKKEIELLLEKPQVREVLADLLKFFDAKSYEPSLEGLISAKAKWRTSMHCNPHGRATYVLGRKISDKVASMVGLASKGSLNLLHNLFVTRAIGITESF